MSTQRSSYRTTVHLEGDGTRCSSCDVYQVQAVIHHPAGDLGYCRSCLAVTRRAMKIVFKDLEVEYRADQARRRAEDGDDRRADLPAYRRSTRLVHVPGCEFPETDCPACQEANR